MDELPRAAVEADLAMFQGAPMIDAPQSSFTGSAALADEFTQWVEKYAAKVCPPGCLPLPAQEREINLFARMVVALRGAAQGSLERDKLAETIHNARWPADRQLAVTPFADEDRNGREYCYRIADAILNATPANRSTAKATANVGDDRQSMGSEPAMGIVTGGSDPTPSSGIAYAEQMRPGKYTEQSHDSKTWTAGIDVLRSYPYQNKQWHLHAIEFHHKVREEAEALRDRWLAAMSSVSSTNEKSGA